MIALQCAGCQRRQGFYYARGLRSGGSAAELATLIAMRARELGWRATANGAVCSDECAGNLARDVTPHVVVSATPASKNASVANHRAATIPNSRRQKSEASQRRAA